MVGGEEALGFDLLRGKLTVPADAAAAEEIRAAVARTGMRAEPWQDSAGAEGSDARRRRRQSGLAAASGLLCAAGLVAHAWLAGGLGRALGGGAATDGVPAVAQGLYVLAIVAGGWGGLVRGWGVFGLGFWGWGGVRGCD